MMGCGPDSMMRMLGYDDFGNCDELLCDTDRIDIELGEFIRVSGDALCTKCGYQYRLHPRVQGALWLRRSCTGLVKL